MRGQYNARLKVQKVTHKQHTLSTLSTV